MSFSSYLHQRVSRPVAFSVIAGSIMLLAMAAWGLSNLQQARLQGDTPEVCRIILEQNPFMIRHFGHLREERFQAGESCVFEDQAHRGCTNGVYTYTVCGTRAEGIIKAAWMREPGTNGSFYIISLQIVRRRPAGMVPSPPVTPVQRRYRPSAPLVPGNPASEA